MSENKQVPNNSEEVDLGQLFKLIGKAFDRFFGFIVSIFKGIYTLILLFMLHIFRRIIWYAAAVIVGLGIGIIKDKINDPVYGANLIIETNFGSTHQVYENLKYLNQLATIDKDSIELAKKLNISVSEAATIKGLHIMPEVDENDKIKMFSSFRDGLDSVSAANLEYKDYFKSLKHFSFKMHRIGVASTNRFLYQKLKGNLVKGIADSEYLNELKDVRRSNLESEKEALEEQINDIDSLAVAYLKIRKRESEKQAVTNAGTNLYMGNAQQNQLLVDESELLKSKLQIESLKQGVETNLVKNNRLINVISDFPDAGYDTREWSDKNKVIYPLLLLLITLVIFSGLGLKKYLEQEENRILKK